MARVLDRRLTPDDRIATPYLPIAFEVPDGTRAVEVEMSYDFNAGVIDIGCDAPGGWRGWSGGARQRFAITADAATWGYLPGAPEPGVWHVVLGLHRVSANGVPVTVDVRLPARARVEPDPPAPPPEPGLQPGSAARALPHGEGLTWFACDFHAHTLHSDGGLSVDQLAARARQAGLDVLAVTDHNTVSAHRQLPAAAARYGLTLIPGQEVTTDRGHANAFGEIGWIDFREHPQRWIDEVHQRGGLISINHPVAGDCSWQWETAARPRLVEAMHTSWLLFPTDTSIWSWLAAWGADGLSIVGGSDFHWPDVGVEVGTPTTWVAAADRSPASILDAIRAGRTSLSMGTPRSGPVLLPDGDELLALDADGAVYTDWVGNRRVVHGDAVRIPLREHGIHRLVAPDQRTLAMTTTAPAGSTGVPA